MVAGSVIADELLQPDSPNQFECDGDSFSQLYQQPTIATTMAGFNSSGVLSISPNRIILPILLVLMCVKHLVLGPELV